MEILNGLKYENIVFIDIETVRLVKQIDPDTDLGKSWWYKMKYIKTQESSFEFQTPSEAFDAKASLYSEFAAISCISVGRYNPMTDKKTFKSYFIEQPLAGTDYFIPLGGERELLDTFCKALESVVANNPKTRLCGVSIIGFDIPFIAKRCIVNNIMIPSILDTAHLKPWEVTAIDLHVIWKGTSFYGASMANMAVALGLPFPKQDMDGSETGDAFYRGEIDKIVSYCESDVSCTIDIFRRLKGEDVIIKSSTLKQGTPEWEEVVARLSSGFDLDLIKIKEEYEIEPNELKLLQAVSVEAQKTRKWEK